MTAKTQAAVNTKTQTRLVGFAGLMAATIAGAAIGAMFTGAPAHSAPKPKSGYSLTMLVQVADDEDTYTLDSGMRAGECTIAARGLKPSYRTYHGVRIATTYACVR